MTDSLGSPPPAEGRWIWGPTSLPYETTYSENQVQIPDSLSDGFIPVHGPHGDPMQLGGRAEDTVWWPQGEVAGAHGDIRPPDIFSSCRASLGARTNLQPSHHPHLPACLHCFSPQCPTLFNLANIPCPHLVNR